VSGLSSYYWYYFFQLLWRSQMMFYAAGWRSTQHPLSDETLEDNHVIRSVQCCGGVL